MSETLALLCVANIAVIAALFWLTQRQRQRIESQIIQMQAEHRAAIFATRANLADFKLHVAQHYQARTTGA
jgi:ABC-type bacteriocin/lantibiotic exporter with double-glycine peptidase domain